MSEKIDNKDRKIEWNNTLEIKRENEETKERVKAKRGNNRESEEIRIKKK